MHGQYSSYAIAWIPRTGSALARFGKGWTGWCPEHGSHADPAERVNAGADTPVALGPIAYRGLHAEFAAPFRLPRGRSFWRLDDEVQELARSLSSTVLPRLSVALVDDRVMLVPERRAPGIDRIARSVAEVVTAQDEAATPAGMEALPERPPATPDPAFRIALTGALGKEGGRRLAATLQRHLAPMLAHRQVLDNLALLGDPGEGRPWRLIQRYPLTPGPVRAGTAGPAGMDCPGLEPMPPLGTVMGSNWETVIT